MLWALGLVHLLTTPAPDRCSKPFCSNLCRHAALFCHLQHLTWGIPIMRYVALWFLGVPVSVIVLLALFNVI
jgi:hypothetical protein